MSLLGYRVNEGEGIPWTAIKGQKVARHLAVNELGELIAAASPTTLAKLEELIAQAIQIEINTDAINLNVDELEDAIGRIAENNKQIDPDTGSASLNALLRGMMSTLVGAEQLKMVTLIDDTSDAGITYIGKSKTTPYNTGSPEWQIKRIDESSSPTVIDWGGSNTNFDQEWDERTAAGSVSYG